ncbi:hypothetical protein ACFPU1_13065 [Thalassorhabdus alkalitolerans]|uniref:Uncharacterized protein n=1 Tax=Thalassorhabdus alkalitolerans TaxID=2282697 RepID=A0ABW0YMK9_9BACI|nr:hypothetical protein [Bacillus sp. FJAT-44742]
MELVKCQKNVCKHLGYDFVEIYPPRLLFKEGYIYPAYQDKYGSWLATDEEGQSHVVSETINNPEEDPWFRLHFKKV